MQVSVVNGRLIDPANALDELADLHISDGRVIAVGGCCRGDGCTSLVMTLGSAFAADERKTLVIDGDATRPDLARLLSRGDGVVFGDVGRNLDPVPDLSVDLDDQRHPLLSRDLRIGLRPRFEVDARLVSSLMPQLLGEMRGDRSEQGEDLTPPS